MVNEAGAIDPNGIAADGFVSEPALFQRVNIPSRLPGANARGEAFRAVISSPFIGNAYILRLRHPAFTRRTASAAAAVGRMNLDPVRIFPVPNILRGGMPPVLDEGLRNLQRFGSRDGLG
jgi:hypothetical protein